MLATTLIFRTNTCLTLAKKRVIKDYEALPEDIIRLVKLRYPTGFAAFLVQYTNKEGKLVSALPFETDEMYYLIRMTMQEAKRLVKEDEDYDDEGVLREDFGDIEVESEFDGAGEQDEDVDEGISEEDDHIIVTRRRDDDEPDDIPDDTEF
jgi:DNA-directed RNA polymerase subunit delta